MALLALLGHGKLGPSVLAGGSLTALDNVRRVSAYLAKDEENLIGLRVVETSEPVWFNAVGKLWVKLLAATTS